ncbi:type VI secretion system accessory protein TagJ [Cellvibrio sp. OA-2007]|uniref:type VI secretion system accessory protein TagJ n=1 Tax=Cellvibrio sp. OA-2007 TaxID=529823 RepID=UPI000780AA2B|nr:type VI secretion system accessory protein TagJ [Cellvibrio sp. OA-2007]
MQATAVKKTHSHDIAIAVQIEQLYADIRNHPGKVEYRIHLAQLLMVNGQWNKALQQLQTAAQLDTKAAAMAQSYRALIQAETAREQVFQGLVNPQHISSPDDWEILLAESLVARAHHQLDAAEKFLQQAFNDAPACAFTIDGSAAAWIADGDSRLGPVCEVFINGQYFWIPFNKIHQITIEAPQDLRDLVWIPATITLTDFSRHFGFLPSRYPLSYAQANDQLSLASLTEWAAIDEHSWAGLGQKILVTNHGEYPLLAVRTLTQIVMSE